MMNKKNKVLLSTVGLLLLSGIAATSSTFAWFTTVRSATVNYGTATAGTTSGSLELTYKGSLNTIDEDTLLDNVLTLEGVNKVTDISGDGKSFFKPVWATQNQAGTDGTASQIDTLAMAGLGVADGYFVDFTINVARGNDLDQTGLKVYLGAGTKFTSADANLLKALRLAVLDGAGDVILRWAPEAEAGEKYLAVNGSASAYGVSGFEVKGGAGLKSDNPISTLSTVATADAHGYLLATLDTEGEVLEALDADLTFRAWIEGTDVHTVNSIIGSTFDLEIDLYALEIV